VTNYSGLEIINFRGTGAPGNNSAYPVSLINGNGFKSDLDEKFVRVR
jgi:hypothetical protein